MSEIKNGGLDQYGAEPFEQQQFGITGTEGVKPYPLIQSLIVQQAGEWALCLPLRPVFAVPLQRASVSHCHIIAALLSLKY